MAEDWTPEEQLRMTREREHVVSAIAVGLADWRGVLEAVEGTASVEDAQAALSRSFGFTEVQSSAVLSTQFRRVTRVDRNKVAAELEELRREIQALGGDKA